MSTANKKYNYDDIYHNKTLDEWCVNIHKYMSFQSHWKYYPLEQGAFGYDNIILSIGNTFDKYNDDMSLDDISSLIHIAVTVLNYSANNGWIKNYIYWRDNKPWEKIKFYKKP
jgi:hypothetical protein